MKLIKHKNRDACSGSVIEAERILDTITFDKFKFNHRSPPGDKNKIILITCFSEFGVESVALMYSIPQVIQIFRHKFGSDCYFICVGWHGRDYLYRHLVDEYWAVKEEYQWLREYSMAFRSTSKNIARLEKSLKSYGTLYEGQNMGAFYISNLCRTCGHSWGKTRSEQRCDCPKCNSSDVRRGMIHDIQASKKVMVRIPLPSEDSLRRVEKYLRPNSVGIFARNRACYGRNLGKDFYSNLILFLKFCGYNPVWLGERQSTLPCPVDDIVDFRSTEDANNLELTLALVSKLKFTVQFWTASTRLASVVGTPWILFESPDQIVGSGQEGVRIAMTTDYNKKKIVLADYNEVAENNAAAMPFLNTAIQEMNMNNWDTIIGPVKERSAVEAMMLNKSFIWEKS